MSGFVGGQLFGSLGQVATTPNVLQSLVSPSFIGAGIARLASMAGIGDIPNLILVLGGVPFFDMEVPAEIHAGGEQAMHVHKYPGGTRVIDTTGPDDSDIVWSGWFMAFMAEARARQIDSMRRNGTQLSLTWSSYSYKVVIKKFEFFYNRFFQIRYELVLTVVQDVVQSAPSATSGIDQLLNSAMSSVTDAVSGAISAVTALPGQLLSSIPIPTGLSLPAGISTATAGVASTADVSVNL